jgi:hypothetical protein
MINPPQPEEEKIIIRESGLVSIPCPVADLPSAVIRFTALDAVDPIELFQQDHEGQFML